jgi:hypothetical protein
LGALAVTSFRGFFEEYIFAAQEKEQHIENGLQVTLGR